MELHNRNRIVYTMHKKILPDVFSSFLIFFSRSFLFILFQPSVSMQKYLRAILSSRASLTHTHVKIVLFINFLNLFNLY